MQIFLSFPSELESAADEIAQSLRNCDYDVFFSHDDLPPGDSFDMRVETAISKSDFMVFLISPESVTRGRYTLTEMGFARTKWPNPSKRVLPVMAVPTPLENVPSYLKAVTILEPEGNMAAETRAAVDRLLGQTPTDRRSGNKSLTLTLAILALMSAFGSYLAMKYSPDILQFSFGTGDPKAAILPGVLFGAVVATCNAIFGIRDRFQLALVIVVTMLAWIIAFDVSKTTFALLDQYSRTVASDASASDEASSAQTPEGGANADAAATSAAPATPDPPAPATETFSKNPAVGYIIGLIGGAVGGTITILGLLITNPGFRRLESVMVCWATATVAGAAYGFSYNYIFVLFAVWQIAVILAIARGFSSATAQIPGWLAKISASTSYTSAGAE